MSGWYVQRLLIDRENIRSSLFGLATQSNSMKRGSKFTDFSGEDTLGVEDGQCTSIMIGVDFNVESDVYSDLLTLEKKINELASNNLLTDREINIIKAIVTGDSFTKLASDLGVSRITVSKEFKLVCDKIAYHLGDHFTDEGYQEYLRDKYDLSEEEVLTLDLYMKNKFRRK